MKQPLSPEECVRLGLRMAYYMHQGHREGQAAFNALHDVRPDIAEQVRGSSNPNNPFYRDDRIQAFWLFVFNYGNGSVSEDSTARDG